MIAAIRSVRRAYLCRVSQGDAEALWKGGGGSGQDLPHRAKLVRKLLRENKNIRIIYLPKGSPYLNAVEECWRRRKQVLLVSEYYKTFVDMCSAIFTYYRTARFTLDILKFANRKAALFCTNL